MKTSEVTESTITFTSCDTVIYDHFIYTESKQNLAYVDEICGNCGKNINSKRYVCARNLFFGYRNVFVVTTSFDLNDYPLCQLL